MDAFFLINTFFFLNELLKETLALRHLNLKKWRDLVVSEEGLTFDCLHINYKLCAHCPAPLKSSSPFLNSDRKVKTENRQTEKIITW